jgi:hypothetical protein
MVKALYQQKIQCRPIARDVLIQLSNSPPSLRFGAASQAPSPLLLAARGAPYSVPAAAGVFLLPHSNE